MTLRPTFLLWTLLLCLDSGATAHAQQGWDDIFGPIDAPAHGDVRAIAVEGNTVYLGGSFRSIGIRSIQASATFNLDTREWSPLCDGVTGETNAIAMTADEVVLAGRFKLPGESTAQSLLFRRKDGGACRTDGFPVLGQTSITSLHVVGTDLFIGGNFIFPGSDSLRGIVRFDTRTRTYHPLGSGIAGVVQSIDHIGDSLYVGGSFTIAGGKTASGVAIWNIGQSRWEDAPLGLSGSIAKLTRWGERMLVSGRNVTSRNGRTTHSAIVEAGRDSVVPLGISHIDSLFPQVGAAAIIKGKIMFASRTLSAYPATETDMMVAWDTATGTTEIPGGGVRGITFTLTAMGEELLAGGSFQRTGDIVAENIAIYDAGSDAWSALPSRTSNGLTSMSSPTVYALAVRSGEQIYAGGSFRAAGGQYDYGNIALWTGSRWQPLGAGVTELGDNDVSGHVQTILPIGDTAVVVGGSFARTTEPYLTLGNIARWSWNDSAWHQFGDGFNSDVLATALGPDGAIYAGGSFARSGATDVAALAVWRDGKWTQVIPELSGTVKALGVVDNRLYIGGSFRISGDDPANGPFCILDLTTGGVTVPDSTSIEMTQIYTIAVRDGRVLAAGIFNNRMSGEAYSVAELVENQWRPIGETPQGRALAMAVGHGTIVVGGSMSLTGGPQIANLGFWNGERWRDVQGGSENMVFALAMTDSFLYVGGQFQTTGDVVSPGISRWRHDDFRGLVASVKERSSGETAGTIVIHPNPARDVLAVRIGRSGSSATELRIFDSRGRLRTRHDIANGTEAQLDISDLEPGIYLLVGRGGDTVLRETFVVVR